MTVFSIKPVALIAMMCTLTTFFFSSYISWAQRMPLTQEAQSDLDYFLNRDCGTREQSSALDRLLEIDLQFTGAIEYALRDVLLYDAFSYSEVHIHEGLARNWDNRRAFLARGKHTGLTDHETKQLLAETKDAYVERNMNLYKAKRRYNAVHALVAIGSDTAFATLSVARSTGDAVLQSFIDASLKRARLPSTGQDSSQQRNPEHSDQGSIKRKENTR